MAFRLTTMPKDPATARALQDIAKELNRLGSAGAAGDGRGAAPSFTPSGGVAGSSPLTLSQMPRSSTVTLTPKSGSERTTLTYSAGTITYEDQAAYTLVSADLVCATGSPPVEHFIYFSPNTSKTALQISTTATDALNDDGSDPGKFLLAVAIAGEDSTDHVRITYPLGLNVVARSVGNHRIDGRLGVGKTTANSFIADLYDPDNTNAIVRISGDGTARLYVNSDEDNSGAAIASIDFQDDRTTIWEMRKDAGNDWQLRDTVNGRVVIEALDGASGELQLQPSAGKIRMGGEVIFVMATENTNFKDAGSTGATEQDWIEVTVGGVTGYIRVFATK